jgi:hypothetical protein
LPGSVWEAISTYYPLVNIFILQKTEHWISMHLLPDHSIITNAVVQFTDDNVHSCVSSKVEFHLASHFPSGCFVSKMASQYDAWQHESGIHIESCKIEVRRIQAREIVIWHLEGWAFLIPGWGQDLLHQKQISYFKNKHRIEDLAFI